MPLTAHLKELRGRLIRCCAALAVAFFAAFAGAEVLFGILIQPLFSQPHPELSLIGTGVADAFFTKIKVAFAAAIFLGLPVILWQSWQFVAPGLYEHEKHLARRFVFYGSLFFLLGAAFCYTVVFDAGFTFFLKSYRALGVRPAIRVSEYLTFSARLLLAFGIAFELPVLAYFLARVGLIDHRLLLRHFRYALILILLIAAILTPPDVVSQVLLAVPFLLLYGVSIGVAYLARK